MPMQSRTSWMVGLWVLSCVGGCSDDKTRPPLLDTTGDFTRVISCDALRSQALEPGNSGQFAVPGGFAQCVANGQYCPTPWLAQRCDAGEATALCVDYEWRATCALVDGGNGEAGEAGGN